MLEGTVKQFAAALEMPVEKLIKQLEETGLSSRSAEDPISSDEKKELLGHLRRKRGRNDESGPKKITLKRKTVSEIKLPVAGPGGRAKTRSKTVTVEVRKRRTYAQVGALKEEAEQQAREAEKPEAQPIEEPGVEAPVSTVEASPAPPVETPTPGETAEAAAPETATPEIAAAPETAAPPDAVAPEAAVITEEAKAPDLKVVPPPPSAKPGRQEKSGRTKQKKLHVVPGTSGRRRKKQRTRRSINRPEPQHVFEKPTELVVLEVEIPESITVAALADRMSVKGGEVVKKLMELGSMVTINQMIDQDTAASVVELMGHKPKTLKENALEEELIGAGPDKGEAVSRPPVVTVMGHVDHGKTTLLDFMRKSKVAAGEAGGVTQHIGAYSVKTPKGNITFLDTPGHEAFTAMRARGAKATDIVVLVVAADDGVMPQTQEAIQHAKAGEVPIIVAVNKIDKPDADPERARQELAKFEVVPEDWGGDTQFVDLSAATGEGVDKLLESLLLQAEVLELKAVKDGPASGTVIESRLDKGRGPIATILVQEGKLAKGDVILAGHEFGKVRGLYDEKGGAVAAAGPASPVEVLGLSGTPNAGDDVRAVSDESKAREIALFRQGKYRAVRLSEQRGPNLNEIISNMGDEDGATAVNVLIKADVQGSAEALSDALRRLSGDEVAVNVISAGIGGIKKSDIDLAIASKCMVVGFNTRVDSSARKLVDKNQVDLRYYSVIYDVIEDVKAAINGMLSPEIREQIIGVAEVREVFRSPKFGEIAGCLVSSGLVRKANPIRVLRDNVVVYEGELESLRRFKDDVNEVKSGVECGIGVKNYTNVKPGDQIEVFERIEVARNI